MYIIKNVCCNRCEEDKSDEHGPKITENALQVAEVVSIFNAHKI